MKLTIFGASGRTGQQLVIQALQRGHEVTAFARSSQKLAEYASHIRVVEGDAQDSDAVQRAVAGADAVLSVLGPTANSPDHQITRATRNILSAMNRHGVRRLVVSAGAGVGDPQDEPRLFNKLINLLLRTVSPHVFEDMKQVVATVRTSDVDWTVVRVPMLVDGPAKGQIKPAYVGKGMGPRITRADMASFMLD
ncbi:MAG TPA: SDR family oxidoreductase, partial [Candidatus Binatia bacterium]|nr:SDR family oxidoreductase [Candidatus Binatia bacterium]